MENLLNSGIQFILWLQSLGGWLTPIMKGFTFLGNEEFYLLIAPAILWCVDASLGIRVGLFIMINGMVNAALKVAFHGPRPYWYSDQVKVLGNAENSFGVPSNHSQNAVVVWGTFARHLKQRWAWIIAVILMFFIGISRMYLALHFPQDVLLGWLFGILMLWAMLRLEKPVQNWLKKYQLGIQVLFIFIFSLILILIVIIAQLSLGNWILPAEWIKNAHLAFPDEPALNPLSFHNFLTSAGAFFGLAAGWICLSQWGGFSTRGVWWKLVLRYVIGILGILILWLGLGKVFPETETFISYVLRYIRYALIGAWISGFAPWFFIKINLATRLK